MSESRKRKVNRERAYDDIEIQIPPPTNSTDTQPNRKDGEVVKNLFEDYCTNSTIHGVRYFGEKKRHWIERCCWIIGLTISLSCCAGLIYKTYSKWNISSVIVSFGEELTPVWHIPFPAVTICPTTKVDATLYNITSGFDWVLEKKERPQDFTDEEFNVLIAVSQICEPYIGEAFGSLKMGDNVTDSSIVDLLMKAAPRLNDTVYEPGFINNKMLPCRFDEFVTEEGLCFTFNTLSNNDTYTNDISPDYSHIRHNRKTSWNLESGYNEMDAVDATVYPYKVTGSGADGDKFRAWLELAAVNFEYLCRGPIQGYKIVLHVPGEIPQVSKYFFLIPLLQEVTVSVEARVVKTSEGLRHYHHERRKCYFDSERKLRFLKLYTKRNCELECLSNATLNSCGCVTFFLPRDATTPICGSQKVQCYHSVRDNLLKSSITPTRVGRPCNCLPACNSIIYEAQISQNPFDWNNYAKTLKVPKNETAEFLPTRFQIFFKENEFRTLTRSELYGPIDFVASCGGLLGLFMGASFLSIFELLYFCSLRLCCNIRTKIMGRREATAAFTDSMALEGRIVDIKQRV